MPETLKKQFFTLGAGAVLFGVSAALMLLFVDPFKATPLVLGLMYVCLGAFAASVFTPALYLLRRGRIDLLPYQRLRIALREALLLAILLAGSLALSAHQLLYWWIEAIFFITIVLIEAFFLI